MTAADTLRRQAELQAAQRARETARTCAKPDCVNSVSARSVTDLCTKCWRRAEGLIDSGGKPRESGDMPEPPTGMSHGIDQSTHGGTRQWWVMSGCVLCGGPTVRVDQRGVDRGPATITRQLIALVPGVPFIVGARCATCQSVVRANSDRLHPVVVAVCQMLGRADFDIFALRVVTARMAGLDDPEPPDAPWGHTFIGPLDDEVNEPAGDDVQARLTRLERLIASEVAVPTVH